MTPGPAKGSEPPVGREWPPHSYEVGREKIREYAAAIGAGAPIHHDPEAARAAGFEALVAPPLFAAVYVAPAVATVMFDPAVGVFDPAVGLAGYRFVQRSQWFGWERPVCAGDRITTVARLAGAGERDGALWRSFESESVDGDGELVLRGRYEGVVPGPRKRRSSGPAGTEPVRPAPAGTVAGSVAGLAAGEVLPPLRVVPDRYAPCRYAGASGDFTPFHLDDELARALGLPGVILHGLYTLAQLGRGLIEPFGGDPRLLRSLGARLRRPALPEHELVVSATVESREAERTRIACQVVQDGKAVISDGEAVLVARDK